MTDAPPVVPTGAAGGGRDWWHLTLVWWHAAFAGLTVVVAAVYAVDGVPAYVYAFLAALFAWYELVGARAMRTRNRRLGVIYLAGAFALFAELRYQDDTSAVLLYGLYPQTFAVLARFRTAVAASGVLSVILALAGAAGDGWTRTAVRDHAADGVTSFAISVLIGSFLTAIVRESGRRAEVIEELEATRAELAAAHHEAGVLAERERLAGEIHDTLAQGFTSMLMLIQAADAALDTCPEAVRHRLGLAEQTARENLAEARALVAALAPVDLQTASLGEALERQAQRFGEETGTAAVAGIDGEPRRLSPNVQIVLLRAAQEALANVRKHAEARAVSVRLSYRPEQTVLEVSDNGRGFDPDVAAGFGLRSMRKRAEQVGGRLEVNSAVGRGTTVRVMIP